MPGSPLTFRLKTEKELCPSKTGILKLSYLMQPLSEPLLRTEPGTQDKDRRQKAITAVGINGIPVQTGAWEQREGELRYAGGDVYKGQLLVRTLDDCTHTMLHSHLVPRTDTVCDVPRRNSLLVAGLIAVGCWGCSGLLGCRPSLEPCSPAADTLCV